MDWARILAYVTGTVDQELQARNEYLAAENRACRMVSPTPDAGPHLCGSDSRTGLWLPRSPFPGNVIPRPENKAPPRLRIGRATNIPMRWFSMRYASLKASAIS